MKSIALQSHVGTDGILRLQLPVEWVDIDLDVMVIVQPLSTMYPVRKENGGRRRLTTEELGWPPGFFENTFGSTRDDPLVYEPVWQYETRDILQ